MTRLLDTVPPHPKNKDPCYTRTNFPEQQTAQVEGPLWPGRWEKEPGDSETLSESFSPRQTVHPEFKAFLRLPLDIYLLLLQVREPHFWETIFHEFCELLGQCWGPIDHLMYVVQNDYLSEAYGATSFNIFRWCEILPGKTV